MVFTIADIGYTRDYYYAQNYFGCCVDLCPCVEYLYRLISAAVCYQPYWEFCIQLLRLEAAKPKLKF